MEASARSQSMVTVKDTLVTILLNCLTCFKVDSVAAVIRKIFANQHSERRLQCLADEIFKNGIIDVNYSTVRYLKLAKSLYDLEYSSGSVRGTFKELFLKTIVEHSTSAFDNLELEVERYPSVIRFYAKIFEEGMVSPVLVLHWLTAIKHQSEYHLQFLKALNPVVTRESQGNSNFDELKKELVRHGVIGKEAKNTK